MTLGAIGMLNWLDLVIIGIFFVAIIMIGLIVSRTAGKSSAEFFLGGRSMPWWLLGVSMVACTFSCDTPNLVTDMVRTGGVVANWGWWAFLITGMVTVFIYAQLWRRSKVMTDLEFYEMRYSGASAAVIRGFRSLYLGVLFNCLIMGTVTLAAIKIGQVIFGVQPLVAVVCGSIGVVIYATAGGIKSCLWADFFQYSIAMFGAVYAAYVAVHQPEVGSLGTLLEQESVVEKLRWMPDFSNWLQWVPLLLIPVAVQWWAVWYPGAEPGGGGYIAQRMLSAKNEKHAMGATLFFNFMHYALRPWPWIIVALASIVCYPTLESIKAAFPGIDPTYLKQDIAYPVMISRLSPGFLGLVVASLIAAYMSTIGTHLNWGSSYVVNDFYKRFWKPEASEKELVTVGRVCTVGLMIIAGIFALTFLENAFQAFQILLLSGAGTGAIYLLRWFWWRINAWTEIVAMIVATIVAFWIVLGVGEKGTLAWYMGTSAVEDRVMVIDNDQVVNEVQQLRAAADEQVGALTAERKELYNEWKAANKAGDIAARDAARDAFEAKVNQIAEFESEHSVLNLTLGTADAGLDNEIEQFYQGQKKYELLKVNDRRTDLGLPAKDTVDVSLGGLITNGKIYLYHPDVTSLVFPVQLLVCVILVTVSWIIATFVTPPVNKETLRSFYKLCHPGGPGWKKVVKDARADGVEIDEVNAVGDWKLPLQLLCVFLGCVAIYSSLFSVGNYVYGNVVWGTILLVVAIAATVALFKSFSKMRFETDKQEG